MQVVDNRCFVVVSKQVNDMTVAYVSDDTSVLVEQIQFVNAQVANFSQLRLNTHGEFFEQKAHGSGPLSAKIKLGSSILADLGVFGSQQ